MRIGRAYGRAVNDRLGEKWAPGEGLVAELADADTAKTILDALESRRRSPSLYALHLYDMAREGQLTPDILRFLDEENAALGTGRLPSPARRRRARLDSGTGGRARLGRGRKSGRSWPCPNTRRS